MPRIPINIAEHRRQHADGPAHTAGARGLDVELYGKLEAFNPGGSVKDRIGVAMLDAAERAGRSSPAARRSWRRPRGNTGIALAFCCAAKGYDLSIFLPRA